MALSDLVTVTYVSTNPGVTQAGFGVPLILSHSATWTERVRTYSDLDGVADDFAANTPEYLAAEVMFSQSTGLTSLKIGRAVNVPTQRFRIECITATVGGVYNFRIAAPDGAAWTSQDVTYTAEGATQWLAATAYTVGDVVTNDSGKLYVCLVGGTSAGAGGPTGTTTAIIDNTITWTYAGAGAADSTSTDCIIQNLKIALDALNDPAPNVISSLQGSVGSYYLRIATNAGDFFGIQVDDLDLLECYQDHADPGVAADLTAIAKADRNWYGLVTLFNSEALVLAAAAWVEANEKLYTPDTQDTRACTEALAGATDIIAQLKTLAYARTAAIYHPANDEFAGAARMARWFPIDPGGDNWIYKTLSGVSATELSATHETNLRDKYGDWYAELAGVNIVQGAGKVSANEYIDVVRFRDWYKARLQERCANALIQEEKIPYTDDGIAKIEAIVRGLNDEGIDAGGIAKDPKPTVIVPKAASVSSANRAARILTGVKSTWRLAGAINEIDIRVSAQP